MPTSWKTVRVFISSTFRDMQAERDHLVRFVFPRLRERLLPRRIHLVDVDLRWGLTSEQDASEVCREIITECRPRFLCMLGGRYGTIPAGKKLSITADEVHFGVLGEQREKTYALFYFRHGAVTEEMDRLTSGAIREPRHSDKARKLARLKLDIHKSKRRPFLYRPRWNADEQRLLELTAFGHRVERDILATIDDEFGTQQPAQLDEFAEENAAMEAFVEERSERFVLGSREPVLNELLLHASVTGGNGYLCLTGPPGSGKSALLAHLSQYPKLNDRSSSLLIRHFVGASAGSTDARRVLRRLCHELKEHCPDITAEIPDGFEKLRAAFQDFLKQICAKRRVVILLDAVNQFDAASHSAGLYWLPQELPHDARFILSALDGPALEELRRRPCKAREVELKPLTAGDGEAIIERFRQRYRKTFEPDQRAALLAKTDAGTPLYLLTALEELRTLGTYKEITRRIAELPPTTQELFAWILARLENDDGFRDATGRRVGRELVSRFATLLGASRHGLSQRELVDLLDPGDPQGNIAALLYLLRSYLMRRAELLDFYHSQFREAAHTYVRMPEHRETGHASLAAYFNYAERSGGKWQGASPRQLTEFSYHLWQSGAKEALFALARNEDFLSAQQEDVPGQPDLPFYTLRLALNMACAAKDPVRMAEFTLCHAYRLAQQHSQRVRSEMLDMTLLPDVALPRAWGLADALEPQLRAFALLLLAWKLKSLGRLNEAGTTLQKLDERPLPNGGYYRPFIELLSVLLEPEFDSSRWAPALLGSEQILTDDDTILVSDENLERFASTLARHGHFASAKRIAAKISHDERAERTQALRAIANAQLEAGLFADALVTAKEIHGNFARAIAFGEIAAAQAQAGLVSDTAFAEALTIAAQIDPWSHRKEEALGRIAGAQATAQAQAGQFAKALATARGISSSWFRAEALGAIAAVQAEVGRIPDAMVTLKEIYDAHYRAKALLVIATVEAQWGRDTAEIFADALASAARMEDVFWCATVLRDIATVQARAGRFADAKDTATRIEDTLSRADAFGLIAIEQATAGQDPAETFSCALAAAAADKLDRHSYILRGIVFAQTQAGRFTDASATAARIDNLTDRALALRALATAQARANLFDDARASAARIENTLSHTETLASIATVEARTGRDPTQTFTDSLNTAAAIGDVRFRNKALYAIASAQVITNRDPTQTLIETLASAARFDDTAFRHETLREIVVVQAQAGLFADALATATEIEDALSRVRALVSIAPEQAKAGLDTVQTFADALKIAAGIEIALRGTAFAEIAVAQVQTGRFADALAMSAKVPDYALGSIASAQTKAGRFADALAIANRITSPLERAEVLCEIATAEAQIGQYTEGLETLARANGQAERAEVLGAITAVKLQAGYEPSEVFAQALADASELGEDFLRDGALQQIAIAQARAGRFEDALTTAARVKPNEQFLSLGAIAKIQAEAGRFDDARKTVARVDTPTCRVRDLTVIAAFQAKGGQESAQTFSDALAMAAKLQEAWERARAFSDIAAVQAQVGRFADALEAASKIELPDDHVETMHRIASDQVRETDPDAAFATYDMTLTGQPKGLNGIGTAIANLPDRGKAKSALNPYLTRAARYVSSAWHSCTAIAHLYPEKSTEVMSFLIAFFHRLKSEQSSKATEAPPYDK